MQIGVVFPQTEFGNDPAALKDYAQAVEGMGYTHVLAYDHVLGADPDRPSGWRGPYTHEDAFHEVFVLFSFMAAVTDTLRFTTGVLVLPQRQTPLVAKQAASLDVLSGGRVRIGVGVGWNAVEYEGLGADFDGRGERIEEQITVLRKLWTSPLVSYVGISHTLSEVGLNPMPIQQPIPIWFGGSANVVLKRIARMGDGWLPPHRTVDEVCQAKDRLARYMEAEGRDISELGLEPRIHCRHGDTGLLIERMQEWQDCGATHLSINTMGCGHETPAAHLAALNEFAKAAGLS